ncbi:hypothetical protein PFISCL1PPCAC_24163, partial [Pristionchus fissidentatus]
LLPSTSAAATAVDMTQYNGSSSSLRSDSLKRPLPSSEITNFHIHSSLHSSSSPKRRLVTTPVDDEHLNHP